VEFKPNKDYQPELSLSKPAHHIIKANKLVVISAGALGTPQILERSGVGNPELLKRVGVPLVSNVPGVGENYQDHNLLFYPYKSSLLPEETLDGVFSGRKNLEEAIADKDPQLGWNGIGKVKHRPFPSMNVTNNHRHWC
jgi:alcohol oxidase